MKIIITKSDIWQAFNLPIGSEIEVQGYVEITKIGKGEPTNAIPEGWPAVKRD